MRQEKKTGFAGQAALRRKRRASSITIKSEREIAAMCEAGKIAARARQLAGEIIRPGITTGQVEQELHKFLTKSKAVPSFLDYEGFPASVCISVNEQLIHGIPSGRVLQPEDIVSVDVGAFFGGFHGDCADTFIVGDAPQETKALVAATRDSFYAGLALCKEGYRLSDVSHAIGSFAENLGFGVVKEYVGHGIGRRLHEAPEVPNYGDPGRGVRLQAGMTLAIEPMLTVGGIDLVTMDDGWTVVTADGSLSAHFENTILITKGEPEILTAVGGVG